MPGPVLASRQNCISCGSTNLTEISSGRFGDEPLRSFIAADPWGENPLPILENLSWSLAECSSCGQRFHRNIVSPEWNEVRFSRWMSEAAIREFEAVHGTHDGSAIDYVRHVLRLKSLGVRRILDFGCGFGEFLSMCRLFQLDAVGVDRSKPRQDGAGVPVYASVEDAPGSFDAITLFEVLEHLDKPLDTIRTLKARLNPGGVMVVEVPDTTAFDKIDCRAAYHAIHPLEHINAFTPDSLVRIMAQAGFSPIAKKPAFVGMTLKRVAKDLGKAVFKRQSTQRYFVSS